MKPVLYLYAFIHGKAICVGVIWGTSGGATL